MLLLFEVTNPALKIIFTISPVRHLKDGFVENQWSKSNLITALHETLATANHASSASYFPSYEIMMDELRDYRFYAEDMIHPNQVAINYIWDRFTHSWISTDSRYTMQEIDNIRKGLQHKPFNSGSVQHSAFTAKLQSKIEVLRQQFPHIFF